MSITWLPPNTIHHNGQHQKKKLIWPHQNYSLHCCYPHTLLSSPGLSLCAVYNKVESNITKWRGFKFKTLNLFKALQSLKITSFLFTALSHFSWKEWFVKLHSVKILGIRNSNDRAACLSMNCVNPVGHSFYWHSFPMSENDNHQEVLDSIESFHEVFYEKLSSPFWRDTFPTFLFLKWPKLFSIHIPLESKH